MANILIPYYSAYGHIFKMAQAVAEGAKKVEGTEVKLVRIPEFDVVKEAMSGQDAYVQAQKAQQDIPEATHDDLVWADGIIWGIPTRYGSMPAQMKQFLDSAGQLWLNGSLEGKPTAIFTSTGSIHGGQETTVITSLVPLLHFGMIFVGLPYGENPEQLTTDGIGGSPYGASTVAGPDGSAQPDDRDLTMASRLGERLAKIAKALKN
ncbi:flavoprotein WrbA [Caldalkalibacillus thermarum TA2.A1]|uniref:Flavoprotein WrbA n=1 Tax=Caldalkalibacillus thermarum (strain TA2.A1) TaxID=986075 RepID=F5L5I7_CALTT|nr:NAD(P)H:quinone oxidoreductase [Caldalkalibacillus thermarum]EGL83385.1 flavoprotein WrbA [Caldalkalibacillus thermarum TA2.A1]QZT34542.1 NAD(P)H:quinone oxidoreductase [Caldalkalibacillus thermarum TA2.A1]